MNYSIQQPTMKSGQYEAQVNVYHKIVDKDGSIWLYKDGKFAADNVYVSGGPGSRGFAGATLKFKLVDGTFIELTGPWHTCASALFKATGVDIRDKHSSRVIISKGVEFSSSYMAKTFIDVLHLEEEFTEGSFDRKEMEVKGKELANELNQKVYFFKETGGGSFSYWIQPNKESK